MGFLRTVVYIELVVLAVLLARAALFRFAILRTPAELISPQVVEFVVPVVSIDRARRTIGSIHYFHPGAPVHLVFCNNSALAGQETQIVLATEVYSWNHIASRTAVPTTSALSVCDLSLLRYHALSTVSFSSGGNARVWYIEDTLQLSLSLSAVNWQERTYVLASKSSMHTNAHDASFTEPVCNPATDFFAFRAESGAHDFIRSVACNCAGMSCDALAGGIQASAAKESAERHSLSCSSFGDASAAAITFPPQMQCQVRDKLPVCANSPVPLGSQIQGSGIDRPHFDMCGYHQGGAEFISCGILNSMQTVALQRFSTFSSGIVDNAQPLILGQSRRSRIRQHEFEVATRNAADLLWRTDSVVLNTCCESFQTPISKRIQQVAILVPSTTRGSFLRHPADVPSLPLFQNLLRTLVLTTSLSAESGCSSRRASSEQFAFHVYVGFDPGDPFYDVSTNRAAVMEYFKKTTSFAALSLHNSGLEHFFSPAVLNTTSTIFSDIQSDVRLTLVRVSGASGAPAWIWNHLAWKAVDEGADFLYQTNDDMEFQTACWANEFVASLQSRFPVVNLGVAAPEDAGNKRVVTQSFVHRTHVEIFGVYYHPVFKNWFSDDWITRVYGLNITAMLRHQKVHNTQIYGTRYSIKRNDGTFLEPAVVQGHYMLREWLQSHSTPA